MKLFATILVFTSLLTSSAAFAELRLDCPTYAPRDLSVLKAAPTADPCVNQGDSIIVLTWTNVLYTCEAGHMVQRYDVSMGRGGLGKTTEGDSKTPIGTYSLGQPRASDDFGVFIPVGYPNRVERAQGFTGGDIGIHGPKRPFACVGALNVSVNWTDGCLAVADDRFITEIAGFVKAHPKTVLRTFK